MVAPQKRYAERRSALGTECLRRRNVQNDRLVTFTDGVLAIIITVMVLELRAPQEPTMQGLMTITPTFLSYVLSFVYVAIYWNNHHHFFYLARRIDGIVLWANLHLLFWLSLIPFATRWVGQNELTPTPTAFYGTILFMAAVAWYGLQLAILRVDDDTSRLSQAIGRDLKGKASPILYLAGIFLAFIDTYLSDLVYVFVAILWIVPDRRVERMI